MATISELTKKQQELLAMLYILDDEDQDDEMVVDIKKELEGLGMKAEEIIKFLVGIAIESKAIEDGRKELQRRATKRLRTAENATQRLRTLITDLAVQFDIKKLDTGLVTLSVNPGKYKLDFPKNYDFELLPTEYRIEKIEYSPLREKALMAVMAGELDINVPVVKQPYIVLR